MPPQPVLAGTARFADGMIVVESFLGPSVRLKHLDDRDDRKGPRPSGHRSGSMGGETDYYEVRDDPFEEGANTFSAAEIDEMYGRTNFEYILPPRLALAIKFANNGTQPVTFAIADVNCILGNFAPRPSAMTLAPGQQASIDPMLSNLDSNFELLDVTLAIKCNGKTDKQVLHLARRPGAPSPAPQPPPRDP